MLTKCVNCGFYFTAADEFCPGCGLSAAYTLEPTLNINYRRVLIIALSLTVLLAALIFFTSSGTTLPGILLIAALLGTVGSLAVEAGFFNLFSQMKSSAVNPSSLAAKERIIAKRIAELGKRGAAIDEVMRQITETDGRKLQEVRQKLLTARELVADQIARYELQQQKIALVRLQNRVEPYLFGLDRLDETESKKGLAAVEKARQELEQLRRPQSAHLSIDGVDAAVVELPEKASAEKRAFLDQLDETEASCGQLREAILSRQAARALQDISPLEEGLRLDGTKDAGRDAALFTIRATLTDFSDSFDELENEYRRIRAEAETEQKLLAG